MLMGGNPFHQKELLEEKELVDILKNYNGVILGFSAGAMNMSKYIIITPCSEEYPDFDIKEGLNLSNISLSTISLTKYLGTAIFKPFISSPISRVKSSSILSALVKSLLLFPTIALSKTTWTNENIMVIYAMPFCFRNSDIFLARLVSFIDNTSQNRFICSGTDYSITHEVCFCKQSLTREKQPRVDL